MEIKRAFYQHRLLAVLLVAILTATMMPISLTSAESTSQWRGWSTWPCEAKVTGTAHLRFHTTPNLGDGNYAHLTASQGSTLTALERVGDFIVVYSEKDGQNVYGWAAYLKPVGKDTAKADAAKPEVVFTITFPSKVEKPSWSTWSPAVCKCGCKQAGCMCSASFGCSHSGCKYSAADWDPFAPVLPYCFCGCSAIYCVCSEDAPCSHDGCEYDH